MATVEFYDNIINQIESMSDKEFEALVDSVDSEENLIDNQKYKTNLIDKLTKSTLSGDFSWIIDISKDELEFCKYLANDSSFSLADQSKLVLQLFNHYRKVEFIVDHKLILLLLRGSISELFCLKVTFTNDNIINVSHLEKHSYNSVDLSCKGVKRFSITLDYEIENNYDARMSCNLLMDTTHKSGYDIFLDLLNIINTCFSDYFNEINNFYKISFSIDNLILQNLSIEKVDNKYLLLRLCNEPDKLQLFKNGFIEVIPKIAFDGTLPDSDIDSTNIINDLVVKIVELIKLYNVASESNGKHGG